jgi:S1-C subfamily serine protease
MKETEWIASGFFYGAKAPKEKMDQETEYFTFLVTNRHVLEGLDNRVIRINPKGAQTAKDYTLTGVSGKFWFGHPNPDIDVAVVPISTCTLRELGIQVSFFPGDELSASRSRLSKLGVAEGDFVYALGFPLGLVGQKRSYAMARLGIIARIRDALLNLEQYYVLDASIFPGNSGGPVVLKPEVFALPETKSIEISYLIGLVQGYIPFRDVAVSIQTNRPRVVFEENSGLGLVIPIDYVDECIASLKPEQGMTLIEVTESIRPA